MRGGRPKTEQWPLARGHSDNRTRQSSQQHQAQSGDAKRGSTLRVPQFPAAGVRERKMPDQVRSDVSTMVSRLQAALNSLGVGDVEEKRALYLALVKAEEQAEEMSVARQIEVTKEFIHRECQETDACCRRENSLGTSCSARRVGREGERHARVSFGRSTPRTPPEGGGAGSPDSDWSLCGTSLGSRVAAVAREGERITKSEHGAARILQTPSSWRHPRTERDPV